ncbi:MAG TPA: response regulator [Lacunisphaera sp.]|nr:response regulator [Lacunisphaera sp.]
MSRILLVDDHEPVCQTLQVMINDMGHDAVIALSGQQAIAAHRKAPVDVLLTDIFMPDMDGYELIQRFRQDFPEVKVIAMTGGIRRVPDGPFLEIAQRIGAQWLLRKPFGFEQLNKVLVQATGPAQESPDAK